MSDEIAPSGFWARLNHYFLWALPTLTPLVKVVAGVVFIALMVAIFLSGAILAFYLFLLFVSAVVILFFVGSLVSVIPTFLIGVVSYRKSVVTTRRRNQLVLTTIFLFLIDRYVPGGSLSLLPFKANVEPWVFWGLASIFVTMQLLGYLSFVYEDGLRYQFPDKPDLWYLLKVLPSGIILFLRDLAIPLMVSVAFLWKYGSDAPKMATEALILIVGQLQDILSRLGLIGYLEMAGRTIAAAWETAVEFFLEHWPHLEPWFDWVQNLINL